MRIFLDEMCPFKRAVPADGIAFKHAVPFWYCFNRAAPKTAPDLAMLDWLGINSSHSVYRVRNDNAFSESAFGISKSRPEFVRSGFKNLGQV